MSITKLQPNPTTITNFAFHPMILDSNILKLFSKYSQNILNRLHCCIPPNDSCDNEYHKVITHTRITILRFTQWFYTKIFPKYSQTVLNRLHCCTPPNDSCDNHKVTTESYTNYNFSFRTMISYSNIHKLLDTRSKLVGTQSKLWGTQSKLLGTQSKLWGTQSKLWCTQSKLLGHPE